MCGRDKRNVFLVQVNKYVAVPNIINGRAAPPKKTTEQVAGSGKRDIYEITQQPERTSPLPTAAEASGEYINELRANRDKDKAAITAEENKMFWGRRSGTMQSTLDRRPWKKSDRNVKQSF